MLATTATANDRVTADVAAQLGTDTLTLRGSLDRESLALSVVAHPRPADGLRLDRRRARRRAARLGPDLHADRRRDDAARVLPRRPRARRRGLLVGDPPDERALDREAAARARVAGGRRDLLAGHGARPPDARLRGQPRRAAVADRVLPAGRPRRPRARLGPRRCCCRPPPRPRSGRSSTRPRSRPRTGCSRVLDVLADGAGDACRSSRPTPGCGAPGSRRCSRCSTSTARSSGSTAAGRRPAGRGRYDARAVRRDRRGPPPRAGARCCATSGRVVPDAAAAHRAGRSGRRVDCGRCAVCTGTRAARRADRRDGAGRVTAPARADRRARAAQDVAVRCAAARHASPSRLRAEPGRALALAEDPAWLEAGVGRAARRRAGVRPRCSTAWSSVLRRWGWPAGRPTWVTWVPSRAHRPAARRSRRAAGRAGPDDRRRAAAADGPGFQRDAATSVESARAARCGGSRSTVTCRPARCCCSTT